MACRICLETGHVYKLPCACKGSLGYVHSACFVRWMMLRVTRQNGTVCDVCAEPYRDLKLVGVHNEYVQAVKTMMRCLHAFVAYAVSMFSFCCFWAFNNNLPLDDDTLNVGVVIMVLVTCGTLVHLYQFINCPLPLTPARSEWTLHQFIVSCDKVDMMSSEV